MIGFSPKEGETEPTIMTVEDMMEEELELAIVGDEKLMMASYIPAKKRAIRRKATARHNHRS